jgi:hypothetical protein
MRNQQYLNGTWRWTSCLDSGVLLNNAVALRCLSMVTAEQPPETLPTHHPARLAIHNCGAQHLAVTLDNVVNESRC